MEQALLKRGGLLLALLCILCFVVRLGSVGLIDFNEAFYVQAAREMYLRNDWVTPSVNGVYFFDKPPLALWLCVISFKLFGVSEWSARLPVALAACALVFATCRFGTAVFGKTQGLLAAAILALSPMFLGTARQMTMDIHQTLWITLALFSFYSAYVSQSRLRAALYPACWLCTGMGVMAKSVPGLLPLLAAFVFLLVEHRHCMLQAARRVWQTQPITGLAILTAVVAPWHWAAYRANGDIFYQEYWVLHHLQLASGGDFSHKQPFWYYVPMLLVGMFPFSLWIPSALRTAAKPDVVEPDQRRALKFLLIWAVCIFLFFTGMKSKLISYLLPMYPAAALLTAHWLVSTARSSSPRRLLSLQVGAAAAGIFSAAVCAALVWLESRVGTDTRLGRDLEREAGGAILPTAILAAGIGSAALLWAAACAQKAPRRTVLLTVAAPAALAAALVLIGLPALQHKRMSPLQTLAAEAGRAAASGERLLIHIARPRSPSVFFYMPDALFLRPPGQAILPEDGTKPAADRFLAEGKEGLILTDDARADELEAVHPNLRRVRQNGRWVLLRAAAISTNRDAHAGI
jgi:4-amino-4-deoxy-L-arabinose transferase-like glycosyltransferase